MEYTPNDFFLARKRTIDATYGRIEKSEETDLNKGGEGSRGGKVIGHTKSGKPIYDVDPSTTNHVSGREGYHSDFTDNHKHFTAEDHKDAQEAHMKQHDHHGKEWQKHYDSVSGDEWNDDNNEKGKKATHGASEAGQEQKKHFTLSQWHKEASEKKDDVKKSEEPTAEEMAIADAEYDLHKSIDAFAKPFDLDIFKGGEGSKGGKIIGHTKSGKPVYASRHASHESYKDFDSKDHYDAQLLHRDENHKASVKATKHAGTKEGEKHSKHLKDSHDAVESHLEHSQNKMETVGTTRSGKKIYAENHHPKHKEFDHEDHADAAIVHGIVGDDSKDVDKLGKHSESAVHHWNEHYRKGGKYKTEDSKKLEAEHRSKN